jgi:hypothetical protein
LNATIRWFVRRRGKPKGKNRQDFGLCSFDKARGPSLLRPFQIEGFVSQYGSDWLLASQQPVSFTTQAIENIAAGWRARATYTMLGPDEFVEVFELARRMESSSCIRAVV